MDPIRVGIIGGGRIADLEVLGYLRSGEARIRTVCDLRREVAERRMQEWGAARATTDPAEIFGDPDIDLVEIITPTGSHRALVLAAAAAGKHVSVQKPMGLCVRECEEMIAATRAAGVKFRVYENFVFYPPYVRARELIQDGAIGEPLSIRLRICGAGWGSWEVPIRAWLWRFRRDESGGGPTIWDDGFHKFSVALHLFGPVEQVHAWIGSTFGLIDAPALVTWTHGAPGRTGCIDAAFSPHMAVKTRYYAVDERVDILGTAGSLQVTRCTGRLLDEPPLLLHRDGRTTAFEDLRADWADSFVDCTLDLVRCIREGREPLLTGERGLEVTRFALAALRSAETGLPVRPADVVE